MIKKSIRIWLLFIPLAVLNAGVREKILTPLIGAKPSLPLSGITLILLIFAVSLVFIPKLGRGTPGIYRMMGLLWVLLTITFETGMGFFAGRKFYEIISSYDVTSGNLWLFVVIFIGCVPQLIAEIQRRKADNEPTKT